MGASDYSTGQAKHRCQRDTAVSQRSGREVVVCTLDAEPHSHIESVGLWVGTIVYLVGAITADRDLSIEITRRLQRVWACLQRYKMEIYDRPGVRLRLKARVLKAEVVETLLYGCMTWSPNKRDYDRLRRVHHSMRL